MQNGIRRLVGFSCGVTHWHCQSQRVQEVKRAAPKDLGSRPKVWGNGQDQSSFNRKNAPGLPSRTST